MLGRAVRVQLLMSCMAPEFWGLAMMNVVHIYNCLPHSALDWQVPYFAQTGHMPDVSWFRAFGCAAVVFLGKDLVEHGKLAPRGESGVFVGLGLMHGRKAWLVHLARTNRVYVSTNTTFDETLFPAKSVDQRFYSYYDNVPVEQFRTEMFERQLNSTLASDLPTSLRPLSRAGLSGTFATTTTL
eukprot:3638063-Rhodomonas_salina.1